MTIPDRTELFPELVGLSDDAKFIAYIREILKGIGMYSIDLLHETCVDNGMTEERMVLAARELTGRIVTEPPP